MRDQERAFTFLFLNELNIYPYTIGKEAHGICAINNSSIDELIITLIGTKTINIPVPAGTTYKGRFYGFLIINTNGSTNYDIGVEE